jgi:hypothetical protein
MKANPRCHAHATRDERRSGGRSWVLMEQTDEWTEARRYMGLEFLAKARLRVLVGETPDQDTSQQAITA